MNTGLCSHVFPDLQGREVSGAGDEEVFETKAAPPAVAGPLTAGFRPPLPGFTTLHMHGWPADPFQGSGAPARRQRRSRP
jgi:hypothetical protein